MAKVYIANFSPTGDYSSVDGLGDHVYVTEGILKYKPERLHEIFRKAFSLAESSDYLLLSGTQLVTAAAYFEWVKRFPRCEILVWDRFERKYTLRFIDTQFNEENE